MLATPVTSDEWGSRELGAREQVPAKLP